MAGDTNNSGSFFCHSKGEKNDTINLCIVDSNFQVMEKINNLDCKGMQETALNREISSSTQNQLKSRRIYKFWLSADSAKLGLTPGNSLSARLSSALPLWASLPQSAN